MSAHNHISDSSSSEDDEAHAILIQAVKSVQTGKEDLESATYQTIEIGPPPKLQHAHEVEDLVFVKPEVHKRSFLRPKLNRKLSLSTGNLQEQIKKLKPTGLRPVDVTVRQTLPADEWAAKQKLKTQRAVLKNKIKSGWEVRKAIKSLPDQDGDNVCANNLFLEKVESKNLHLVEALIKTAKASPLVELDVNACNERQKTALRIAVENEDEEMCKLLLDNKVEIKDALFHAMEQNFYRGVTIILKYNNCIDLQMDGDSFLFPAGISLYRFAAWKNKYEILKILHQNNHTLKKAGEWYEGIMFAWESSNSRKWHYEARASPAHITLLNEMNEVDPFEECFRTIKELRVQARLEPMFHERFDELQTQLEEYMCNLMDEVRSSAELSHIFRYEYKDIHQADHIRSIRLVGKAAPPIIHYHRSTVADILDDACDMKLFTFVTHPYAQLAIDYLKYRHTPLLHSTFNFRDRFLKLFVGLLFPILSIFYIVNSRSRMGLWVSYPPISFHCHMVSDMTFIAILFLNMHNNLSKRAYLGMPPETLEIIILIWIIAIWLREGQELIKRGYRSYFNDWWNYNDITYIVLFSAAIICRFLDYSLHVIDPLNPGPIYRENWKDTNYLLIAESLQAYGYVFLVLRLLGLLKTDRSLGPLQISLGRMMINVIQFLVIFALVIFAFAMAFTELFSFYTTNDGKMFLCNQTGEYDEALLKDCEFASVPFNHAGGSLLVLFWAIFGHFDVPTIPNEGMHAFTWSVGYSLLVFYHIAAVIVLINMLIAMMSRTYEETSERSECVWKFNRTHYWIRFIRRESVLPPPMNLIPNMIFLIKRATYCFRHTKCSRRDDDHEESDENKITRVTMESKGGVDGLTSWDRREIKNIKRNQAIKHLVQRYKYKFLLNDKEPPCNVEATSTKVKSNCKTCKKKDNVDTKRNSVFFNV